MPHPRLPKSLLCPGCRMLLDNKTALQHIPGCVQCTGLNTTMKHNRLVKYIFDLAQKAGIQCEKEPRSFSTWQCGICKNKVFPSNKMIHDKTCAGRQLFRSGPDLVIYWSTGEIFYDLTVVHELSNSNQAKSCSQLLTDAIKRKRDTYVVCSYCGCLHHPPTRLLMDTELKSNVHAKWVFYSRAQPVRAGI